MKFWKDARAAYLAVQPPEELEEAVRAGIRTAKRKERERREPRPVIRYALSLNIYLSSIYTQAPAVPKVTPSIPPATT